MPDLSTVEHRYVTTNGVTLHVVEDGPEDGPPLILLHGFPEFWFGWRQQIPALASAGYRVFAPDQRGYNLSEKPRRIEAYSLDLLAADVAGLIRQSGSNKAFLAGHDWGAAVAWWVALKYPELLHKLVILNVPHPIVMRRYIRRSWEQRLRSWYIAFFQLPWLPEYVLTTDEAEVVAALVKGTSREGSFSESELEHYRRAALRPGAMSGMLNWYRAMARTHTERLDSLRVTVPTRIIWGVHDVALSREMAALSLEMCDEGDLVFLEESTHWVQHDEPHRVNELLLDFLQRPD
ncbi:MAG: alpha/beta hydrolase [Anaerolineae bacterium]|nr:alpha/beta hydrolase [Anaerolineae bacterium]